MEQAPFTETNSFSAAQKPFYFVQTTGSLKRAPHWSLWWVKRIQSTHPHHNPL